MRRFCSDNRCQLWHASHDNAHEGQVWWTVALSRRTNRLSSRFRWRRNLEVALKAKLRPVIRAVRATVRAPGRLLLALTAPLARIAGTCAARIRKRKATRALFFFFPWDLIGGADLVHVAIVESVAAQRSLVVFDLLPARPAL